MSHPDGFLERNRFGTRARVWRIRRRRLCACLGIKCQKAAARLDWSSRGCWINTPVQDAEDASFVFQRACSLDEWQAVNDQSKWYSITQVHISPSCVDPTGPCCRSWGQHSCHSDPFLHWQLPVRGRYTHTHTPTQEVTEAHLSPACKRSQAPWHDEHMGL
jgi:hypothetical protein